MKMRLVSRDIAFYPLIFVIWTIIIVAMHGNHSYFGMPLPAMEVRQNDSDYYRPASGGFNMVQAQKALAGERNPKERARILEAIGIACFDKYRTERAPQYLDSAQRYVQEAVTSAPDVPGYYYNLARICTEKKDFASAKACYEKAAAVDPKNYMSYHNLGLLSYYEFKNPDMAKSYFEKALSIDTALPIDNYLLAEIALGKKDYSAAALHYGRELQLYAAGLSARATVMADQASLRLAATLSALELAMLYSSAAPNEQLANSYFGTYLKLETDQQRRQNSINEFQKRHPGAGAGVPAP
jgi:tetratricopeptide (TPR) repeat protein